MEILLLYLIPILTGLIGLLPSNPTAKGYIQVTCMLALFIITCQIAQHVNLLGPLELMGDLIYLDALSVLLLLLISLVGLLASLYAVRYMTLEGVELLQHPWKMRGYYLLFNLFLLTMLVMVTINNLGILWIALESSTFFSALLVGFYNKKEPVEAAWKYILLCTVGLAFALIGITLGYYAAIQGGGIEEKSLNWNYLMSISKQLDPNLLKIAFVFIFVGFGTKVGLAPMHTWLPDAHSEAPTPVSALLSCVLLKCALYGIIRYSLITNAAIGSQFTNQFLLFFGMLSLVIAALFILIQSNIKRLLAYSSLEHIGIIAIGLGFGSPLAIFGALFHMFNHAMAKALMFFTAGNVALKYHSKQMGHIQGAIDLLPVSGALLLVGGLALAGIPPFSLFLSEFYIIQGGLQNDFLLESVSVIILLVIVFGGLAYHVIHMTIGPRPIPVAGSHPLTAGEVNRPGLVAMLTTFGIILLLGFWQPDSFLQILRDATKVITGGHL